MTNWLLGIFLGLVQGISEWLPVSSKTQIIIVSTYLFGLTFSQAYAFGLFLEAASFVAALIYFRKEVMKVLRALVGKGEEEGRFLLRYLVIVTAVTALIGVAIFKLVSTSVTGQVLGIPMILLGLTLLGDGFLIKYARGRFVPRKGLRELTIRDELVIGVVQGIAAFPGVSRSGVTVSAMLLLGVKPEESFRLSFLALIPASVGASLVTVLFSDTQLGAVISSVTPQVILVAIAVAIVTSIVLIRGLLKFAGSTRIVTVVFALGILAILSGAVSLLTGVGG